MNASYFVFPESSLNSSVDNSIQGGFMATNKSLSKQLANIQHSKKISLDY